MKESLIRLFTMIVSLALVAYTGWLFFQGQHVISIDNNTINMIALGLCFLLGLFLFACVSMPALLPKSRRTLLWLGIAIIILSEGYLVDVPDRMIYLADIMKLFGVFLCIVGPMKLLISKQIQEKLEEKELEIIEV